MSYDKRHYMYSVEAYNAGSMKNPGLNSMTITGDKSRLNTTTITNKQTGSVG